MWDRIHSPPALSTPQSSGPLGLDPSRAEVARGAGSCRGRRSPTCCRPALPARRGRCLRCADGLPSHIPSSGSRRHADGSGGLGSGGPPHTRSGSERAASRNCNYYAKRRGGAQGPGGDAGGHRGAAAAAGH